VYNGATPREWLEGHVTPFLLSLLGPRRFAEFVVSQGAKDLTDTPQAKAGRF
jgi:hypothetical protein